MRIAAIYDIHGNLPALEAVIKEIGDAHVDHIVVGGDVVAGPMPVECVDLLHSKSHEIPISFVHGNAESELLRVVSGQAAAGLSPRADEEAEWLATTLRPDQIEFLKGWLPTVTLNLDSNTAVLFCHATPQNDTAVFTIQTPAAKVRSLLGNVAANIVVCGHTHMQFDRQLGGIRIVNAGSVGMPFGQTGAFWLMLDTQKVDMQHTVYDLQLAANRINQSGYPQAGEFVMRNVLSAPVKADAMAMLTQLESLQQAQQ
ncbi:MAG: metallophosphoesterase family protein [Chloroflexota bacterium]